MKRRKLFLSGRPISGPAPGLPQFFVWLPSLHFPASRTMELNKEQMDCTLPFPGPFHVSRLFGYGTCRLHSLGFPSAEVGGFVPCGITWWGGIHAVILRFLHACRSLSFKRRTLHRTAGISPLLFSTWCDRRWKALPLRPLLLESRCRRPLPWPTPTR